MRLPEEDPEAEAERNHARARQPDRIEELPPTAQPTITRAVNTNPPVASLPSVNADSNRAPVVDLDPDDLDINLDYEDSYSVGDGVGTGYDGDNEGEEEYEIDEAFLRGLDEAERRAEIAVQDVIDVDEDSQIEIQPQARPAMRPPPAKVEEIIDISD